MFLLDQMCATIVVEMATAPQQSDSILPPEPAESDDLRALAELLARTEAQARGARILGPNGEVAPLPPSAVGALRRVVDALSAGKTVTLVPHRPELTTRQAADVLHVSRPFLVRNLLGREIPYDKVGTHRRVRLDDVLAYRERRARERRALLDSMTAAAQDVPGGYR